MRKKLIIGVVGIFFLVLTLSFVFAYVSSTMYTGTSYTVKQSSPYSVQDRQTYWPILGDKDQCDSRQDFILQVPIGGCQPSVVRSDLLADQTVPVFCQISAIKLNPLIKVSEIRSISFSGKYPDGVSGAGFHPANAAIRTRETLTGSPVDNNIGYVVLLLKRNENESSLPDFVNATLTARIEYDPANTYGVGNTEFLLQPMGEVEWRNTVNKQTFWNGRYSVRLEEADSQEAIISIYDGDIRVSEQRVILGKESNPIYIPGSYCRASLKVAYEGYVSAKEKATIEISNLDQTDRFDVYLRSRLPNGCSVTDLTTNDGVSGTLGLYCGGKKINLKLGVSDNQVNSLKILDADVKKSTSLNIGGISYSDVYYSTVNGVRFSIASNNQMKGWILVDSQNFIVDSPSTEELKIKDELISSYNSFFGNKKLTNRQLEASVLSDYQASLKDFESIANDYSSERGSGEEMAYGESALLEAIDLSEQFGQKEDTVRLINKFLDTYPGSSYKVSVEQKLNTQFKIDNSDAIASVYLNGDYYNVRLVSFYKPEAKTQNAYVRISSSDGNNQLEKLDLKLGRDIALSDGSKINLFLDKLENDRVSIRYICGSSSGKNKTGTISLQMDLRYDRYGNYDQRVYESNYDRTYARICDGLSVTLDNIDSEQFAKIRIIPYGRDLSSVVNLTVGVGIEKRAVQLSPDKTKEMINKLNDSIEKWETISKNLGKLVSGLKGACFATSAVLQVKNFFSGLSGEGLARQQVMTSSGGWNDRCADLIRGGKYKTLTQCFNGEADNINRDVSEYASGIKRVNDQINGFDSNCKQTGEVLQGDYVDTSCSVPAYARYLIDNYGDRKVIGKNGAQTTVAALLGDKSLVNQSYADGKFSQSELRDLELNLLMQNSSSSILRNYSQNELERLSDSISQNQNLIEELKKRQSDLSKGIVTSTPIIGSDFTDLDSQIGKVADIADSNVKSRLSGFDYYTRLTVKEEKIRTASGKEDALIPAGTYSIGLTKMNDGRYNIQKVVADDGREIPVSDFNAAYKIGFVGAKDGIECNNQYLNAEIKYFENEPYKGMPALVPFDLKRGWYVGTRQKLPISGEQAAYKISGQLSSFEVCNVGKNGREEFDRSGDDSCTLINLDTGQATNQISCLSSDEARKLIRDATNAVQQASRQYGSALVKINVGRGEVALRPKIATNNPSMQCQNFMNPNDCKLLFNVCDPVICPSSRCDFGGQYRVDDVIQSGIVGSSLLCLPNYKEGVAVPVCLTGIQAGVDGYLSILKAHRDCLNESLSSGKTVGICDEIYSIYNCEFFWRQIAPLTNVLVPKIVEMAYKGGQGSRGGGEYLTVQGAWENARKSTEFFTQTYAVNSIKAFQIRSTDEAGSQICKAYVSARFPNAFKSLIEPDSPPQFSAWFSSIKYSDATIPATAQYKVFYHIFAGKDSGVSYRVYLRNPPQSSYYISSQTVQVAAGYLGRGQYQSETRDFTAPEGYKELCVDINGNQECGFTQVSSSFAVNYLRDSYVADQITNTNIISESQCISGTSDLRALANPNLQAGLEESSSPQIYERGVVRICANQNPGTSTDPSRYVDVGYCENKNMRCWLDKNSVSNAITDSNIGMQNATLTELERYNRQKFENETGYGEEQTISSIANLTAEFKKIDKSNVVALSNLINKINFVLPNVYLNVYKAELMLMRARLKSFIALTGKPEVVISSDNSNSATSSTSESEELSSGDVQTFDPTSSVQLEKVYSPTAGKIYIYVGSDNTNIYVEGSKVKYGNENIGVVNSDGVIRLLSDEKYRTMVNSVSEGLYEEINLKNINDLSILEA